MNRLITWAAKFVAELEMQRAIKAQERVLRRREPRRGPGRPNPVLRLK